MRTVEFTNARRDRSRNDRINLAEKIAASFEILDAISRISPLFNPDKSFESYLSIGSLGYSHAFAFPPATGSTSRNRLKALFDYLAVFRSAVLRLLPATGLEPVQREHKSAFLGF